MIIGVEIYTEDGKTEEIDTDAGGITISISDNMVLVNNVYATHKFNRKDIVKIEPFWDETEQLLP